MTLKTLASVFLSSALIGVTVHSAATPSLMQTNTRAALAQCISAVTQSHTYLEAKHQIALQRKHAGTLSEALYAGEHQTLTEYAHGLTLEACMSNQPAQRAFFQCLVDNTGNVNHCRTAAINTTE